MLLNNRTNSIQTIARTIILLFIFMTSLYSKSLKDLTITDVLVSSESNPFTTIKTVTNFNSKIFKIKVIVNPKVLKDKIFYVRLLMPNKYVTASSSEYTLENNFPTYKITKHSPKEIIISFDYKNEIPLLKMDISTQYEYDNIMGREDLLFGMAYGIMLCALLYNLAIFYFNREKSFIYYSCLQFSSISMLLVLGTPIKFFGILYQYVNIFNITLNFVLVFFILFSMHFLDTKKILPHIHKLLNFMLYVTYLDIAIIAVSKETLLYNYIPGYLPIGILILCAALIVKKGYKPAIFYICGWIVLFVCAFMAESGFFDINDTYLLHVAFPLEALIFSFALGIKIKLMEEEKKESEKLLVQQSKLASMGEMVANISHQWRQPLTHLSYVSMNLKAAYHADKLNTKYIDKKTDEINAQIEFMSNTIDDFRNFFRSDKRIEEFGILGAVKNSYSLLKAALKHYDIEVVITCEKEVFIKSYKNEFTQVIFNMLNNSKQAFEERGIQKRKIDIVIKKNKKELSILLSDNALGINEKLLSKVFEPYFTTKDEGMGIGLYMSKVIIEKHMSGKLSAKNVPKGILFEILLPLTKKN